MTGELVVRSARASDADRIVQLIDALAARRILLPRSLASVIEHIRDFVVADLDGEVVGCATLDVTWSDMGEIRSVAVHPDAQNRGVGRALIDRLVEIAAGLGLPVLYCFTFTPGFFEKLGFELATRDIPPEKLVTPYPAMRDGKVSMPGSSPPTETMLNRVHLLVRSLLLVAAATSAAAPAQDQAELAAKRDKKLESGFLKLADWITDYDEARTVAVETGKPIFAYFTRSYAPCPPCSALEAGPLSEELFKYFGQDVVLFCHVTSQVEGDAHQDLLRQKGGSAFPYLAFLDAEGKVIAKPKERTVDAFHDAVEQDVAAWHELVAAAESDEDAAARLFEKRVEFGHFEDFEAARAEMARHGSLSPARKARLEQALIAQEFNRILGTVRGEAEAAAGGARTLPMFEKGRIPKDQGLAFYYWVFLAQHAAETGNADLLGRCIEELGDHSRARPLLPRLKKAYEGLQKKG